MLDDSGSESDVFLNKYKLVWNNENQHKTQEKCEKLGEYYIQSVACGLYIYSNK